MIDNRCCVCGQVSAELVETSARCEFAQLVGNICPDCCSACDDRGTCGDYAGYLRGLVDRALSARGKK